MVSFIALGRRFGGVALVAPVGRSTRHISVGRYRVLTELASGGMGHVSLAVTDGREDFRKLVVVKQLRESIATEVTSLRENTSATSATHRKSIETLKAELEGLRAVRW